MRLIDAEEIMDGLADVIEHPEIWSRRKLRTARKLMKLLGNAKTIDAFDIILQAAIPFDYEGKSGIEFVQYGNKIILCLDAKRLGRCGRERGER